MDVNYLYKYFKEHNIDEKLCSYLISYYFKNKKELNLIDKIKVFFITKKLKNNYPIQYIVKSTSFFGYTYKINKNVLIPRFETELLVEKLLEKLNKKYNSKTIKLLDIGTGSGCIGITLKKEKKNIELTISDICRKALKVAKHNSKGIDLKIVQGNLLKPFIKSNSKFDVIVSNPPYVGLNEVVDKSIEKEPKKAIYAKNNGLYYYEEILKYANKVLNKEHLICFEIGETQKKDIFLLINKYLKNSKMEVVKDYNQKDRILFISNK